MAVVVVACGDDSSPEVDAGTDAMVADAGEDAFDAGVDAAVPFAPDSFCPGGEGCANEGDGVLYAGAAMRDITPVLSDDVDRMTLDNNGDGVWDPFDGDEFEDRNENGVFDPVFIGGFGSPRPASGVNDPQWVRAIALRQNNTTIVILAADMFSIFIDDTDAIRRLAGDVDVDYVATCASHTHQGADTLGIYGLGESSSGADPAYLARIHQAAADAVRDAVADLRPAHIQYATFDFRDQPGGTLRYVSDARHPRIIDDRARIFRVTDASDERTIATWVNLAAHAEYWGDENTLLSSDFPHFLREGVESGVVGPDGERVEGVGGMAAFCEGAIGAQIGPGEIRPETWDGEELPDHSQRTMEVVGEQMAYFVLQALADGGGSVTDETAELSFRNRRFFVDVQNGGFHVAILNNLFFRESFNWNPDLLLMPGVNEPDVRTEVAVLTIGRLRIVWVPGEIDPALFVGGYDGSFTPEGARLLDEGVDNSPDLSLAPEGPYLREVAQGDAEYVGIVSLGNDQVGYLIPDFDFVLDPRNPYIDQAAGEHYEETVAVGIDGWTRINDQIERLLAWSPSD
ncbi:MAG: hypothetical protein AAGE52_04050 [Myxococcota bacterium]